MTIACADCGTLEELPLLPAQTRAICPICEKHLELTSGRSVTAALGCALGTFILLFPANLVPLMSVDLLSMHRASLLGSGVITIWNEHYIVLAILIGLFAVVLPFVRFGLLATVLGLIRLGHRPTWLGPAFRWALWLDIWAMLDVFLVGGFVGYGRVAANLNVTIEWGGYCFIAAAFLSMVSRAALDRRTVWRVIGPDNPDPGDHPALSCTSCDLVLPVSAEGERCPRCRTRLVIRKPDALIRTAALIAAAFILYWPANIYPMSNTFQVGQVVQYRIIDGIRELFKAGLAPLGVLIFITSIAIPVLKILALGWCVLSVVRRSRRHLVLKSHVYRIVDEIGRWSNVDPFTIAVFTPLMQFTPLVTTSAAPGGTPFILVVLFTLLASRSFDPRLMWDAAQDHPHE
jgi:paraquat-inducible protein A